MRSSTTLATLPKINAPERLAYTENPVLLGDRQIHRTRSVMDFLEIPFRNKQLLAVCLLVGVFAGWFGVVCWPRSYQSEARMLIKVGRESVGLDPTATIGSTVTMQRTREEEVVSALEILRSRQVAAVVVDRIGANAILSGHLLDVDEPRVEPGVVDETGLATSITRSVRAAIRSMMLNAGLKDEIGVEELAVQRVESSLHIHAPARTAVISVQAESGSPALAQQIVRHVIEAFQQEHLNSAYTAGSLDFFEKQSDEKELLLNEYKETCNNYMREHNVVSIEANRLLLQQQLSGVYRDLAVAEGDLAEALAAVQDLRAKESQEPEEITAAMLESSDPSWDAIREMVYELELEEERAKASYSERHPRLKGIQKQLAGAREILAGQSQERINTSTTPNPEKIRIGGVLKSQQTMIVGLHAEISTMRKTRDTLLREVDALLGHESFLDVLDRNISQAEADLRLLKGSLEQARVNKELHEKRISNVNVFQPPTFVERPVSPNKRMLALGFTMLGFTTGLGLAFLKEVSSKRIRRREDLSNVIDQSRVISIPWVSSSRQNGDRLKEEFSAHCQTVISDLLLTAPVNSDRRGCTIGVLGVDVGGGASTLAIQLATASRAECNIPNLLIDADPRHRSISKLFCLEGTPGLVELVNGMATHDECVQCIQNSSFEIVGAVGESSNPALAGAEPTAIVQAIKEFQSEWELVILDLPASSEPQQAAVLARYLDYVIVVAESEVTEIEKLERLLSRLNESEAQVLAVVINKVRDYFPRVLRKVVAT